LEQKSNLFKTPSLDTLDTIPRYVLLYLAMIE